jgi:hypothetical protein
LAAASARRLKLNYWSIGAAGMSIIRILEVGVVSTSTLLSIPAADPSKEQ